MIAIAKWEVATAMWVGIPSTIIDETSVIPPPKPAKPVTIPPTKLLVNANTGLLRAYLTALPLWSIPFLIHSLVPLSPGISARAQAGFLLFRIKTTVMNSMKIPQIFPLERFLAKRWLCMRLGLCRERPSRRIAAQACSLFVCV